MWNLFKRMTPGTLLCVCVCVCACVCVCHHHHNHHRLWLRKHSFTFLCHTARWWSRPICLSFSPFIISSLINSVFLHFLSSLHLCLSLTHRRFQGFFPPRPPLTSVPSICLPLLTIRSFPRFIFCLCGFCRSSIHRGRYFYHRAHFMRGPDYQNKTQCQKSEVWWSEN